MRVLKGISLGVILCAAIFSTLALADPPPTMSLQGRLTDDTGAVVADGTYRIEFRIFDVSAGGGALWTSGDYIEVAVANGLFHYLLGSQIPLPYVLSDYDSLWVGFEVEGWPEMTPRVPLTSGMWAMGAMYADTADYARTAGEAGTDSWQVVDSVLQTSVAWGLARGAFDNVFLGDSVFTMVNFGRICTTGSAMLWSRDCAVGGGIGNHAELSFTTVAGGLQNQATMTGATVAGGQYNTAQDEISFVGGGEYNTADNRASVIGGGAQNHANGYLSVIGGGYGDTILGAWGFIGGGNGNHAGMADRDSAAAIGGGWQNETIGSFATLSGGYTNVAQGWASAVGGGGQNATSGTAATIAGGRYNQASGDYATIGGGIDNKAFEPYAFVGGGTKNRASGSLSVVAGGSGNIAAGYSSSILGGANDTITADGAFSYLFGLNSVLDQDSTFMVDMPHIRFGNTVSGYEFPTADGAAGQVMATDGSGRLDWTEPASGSNGWVDDGTIVRLDAPTDNVGIGTATPDAKLHVNGAIRVGTDLRKFEILEVLPTDPAGWADFIAYEGVAIGSQDGGNQQMFIFADGQNQNNIFTVATSQNTGSTWEARFIVEQDGDVGIGVINPSASLEVNGMIHSHAEGFKFPDGSVQTTAGRWSLDGSVLKTNDAYGLTRGNADNQFYGTGAGTMTNLGVACTTGASGFDYLYATVGGGEGNTAAGTATTIAGGQDNLAIGSHATISGGRDNFIGTTAATIGGGEGNSATGVHTTVGGGQGNLAYGWLSTVGGGWADTAQGKYCSVAGGARNYAGGEDDTASFVGGGYGNVASDDGATVSGGIGNTATGQYSTVAGGWNNTASDLAGTMCGGHDNTVSGANAVVCGGAGNSTAAQRSVILGGINNELTAAADFSVAFGSQIYIENPHRVVFYDGLNSGRFGLNRDDANGGINYPIHVGTGTTNGNGAYLTEGGTWTNGSSRTFKENFQPVAPEELLARIAALPIESWNYQDTDERHIGPVAEDFVAAFDVGTVDDAGHRDDKYLATSDVAGVALLGVQQLLKQNEELLRTIEELKREIEELKGR